MISSLIIVLWSLALAALLTLSHTLLRWAADVPIASWEWFAKIGPALAIYGALFLLYTHLLRYFALSQLFPIYTAMSVVGVFLVGVWRFGEPIQLGHIVGLIMVCAGIMLMSR